MSSVVFRPSGRKLELLSGKRLVDACGQAGVFLPSPCGGTGLCGKCRVRVLEGDVPAERHASCLPAEQLARGWRAACLIADCGDLVLADPSGGDADAVVLTEFLTRLPRGESGLWERELEPPPPSEGDRRDDQTRLLEALGEIETRKGLEKPEIDLADLVELPGVLRRSGFRARVTGLGGTVLSIREMGREAAERKLGLAVDLGTTTLAAVLCDLDGGGILAAVSRDNPQRVRGADVISRIEYASRGKGELDELRQAVVGAIEELAGAALSSAGEAARLLLIAVSANAAMAHLLLGASPAALAASPFAPAFRETPPVNAARLGWRGKEPPLLFLVPAISAYVGGDVVAGLVAHDVALLDGATLFLDVGTNGEIVLAAGGGIHACSAPAGPAFEGARISMGMRAAPGAISRIGLAPDGSLETGVIGGGSAVGLCGSGLLDAVATLRRIGVVDEGGRLLERGEAERLPSPPNPDLLSRLHAAAAGPAFWLARPSSAGEGGVALTQRDIRELQLAKGAVAAGVRALLEAAGLAPAAVTRVLLAGGFGSCLNPASALAIGLLPAGFRIERVRSVGNAALAGARLFLLSEEERASAAALARSASSIELSEQAGFQIAFAEGMLFPGL